MKTNPNPAFLLRVWLLSVVIIVVAMLAGAVYMHQLTESLSPQTAIELTSLREYHTHRLPPILASSDRQELADELERGAAKSERLLRRAASIEEAAVRTIRALPRVLALVAVMFLFVSLPGYRCMRALRSALTAPDSNGLNTRQDRDSERASDRT